MSYTGFNINGGITLCFPFYERMVECARRENLPVKMCALEAEDFLECLNRKKQYALNYKIRQELIQHKLLSIPEYDEENDRFIVNNDLPDADKYFLSKEK